MADMCPVCKSGDTQGGLDRSHCLNCGAFFAINSKGESVQVSSSSDPNDSKASTDEPGLNGDGPAADTFEVLEPETKGGRGLPVAAQASSTESALVQEGAVPQHGLLPGAGDGQERTAYDAPDGFTVPVAYNERLDPLAKPLAAARDREAEVEASENAEGTEPQIVLKNTQNNADTLGSPTADKPADPVDDDTKKTGADKDRTFVSAADVTDVPTPTVTPDSLPAEKTAEQHGTGEVVPPDGAPASDVPASEPNPPADVTPAPSNPDSDVEA